jgi:2,4-diketo-3-deoxy-L-fuconate hydrolase
MRFFRLMHQGVSRVGVARDQEGLLLPERFVDVGDIARGGEDGLALAWARIASAEPGEIALATATLEAPISRFRRDIVCAGWNYWDHFEEGKGRRDGQEVDRPVAPTFFTKGPDVVIGPTDPIAFDARLSAKWDYEAELAVVFGRDGRSIAEADALAHVFGYCLANDVSQRDLQRRHGGQWLKGKSIDGTMPLGPMVVTPDEIEMATLRLQCRVNGELRQDAVVAQMAFPLPELIAEMSLGMTLRAGDLLLTGTPAGVGNAMTPQRFLAEGDVVEVSGGPLGVLRNVMTRTDLVGRSGVRATAVEA